MRRLLTLILAALLAAAAIAAPTAGAKKKKGGGGGAVDITKTVAAPIPDSAPFPGLHGLLSSTIDVGKQFKGKRVRDVNVTVKATGASGNSPIQDIAAYLTAPNGATVSLFSDLIGPGGPNVLLGPLTLDDESILGIGFGVPVDPTALFAPWQGSATPFVPLTAMDGAAVSGAWTLRVEDRSNNNTTVLDSWRLNVVAGRPYRSKE